MIPQQKIRDSIRHPLKNTKPARLLSLKESAQLAMAGKEDRERIVQELLKKYF